jgi:ABC-type amino acid transport substrate-binding protein
MKYFVLSILLLFVTFGGFSQPKKNCDEKRTIHIVVEKDLWPFEFVNEKGEPDGFDVDMFKAVMNRAGYKYKMSVTSWTRFFFLVTALMAICPLHSTIPKNVRNNIYSALPMAPSLWH